MSEDVMLQEAIEAIHQGQRLRARDLLTRLLRADKSNPEYWLWLSSVVDTTKEQIYCLQSVLRLDPNSQAANRGLVLLGARPPDPGMEPAPPVVRNWGIAVQEIPKDGRSGIFGNPIVRISIFVVLALVVAGLIGLGIYGGGEKETTRVAVGPKKTTGLLPTFTSTPTSINYTPPPPTPTPSYEGPLPLWLSLDATYTPTPIYVSTPHVANEAFSSAQRALARGDLTTALNFFQQAAQMDADAADIYFYMGEIYRQQEDYERAMESYQAALELNPDFGPAFLGMARVQLSINPDAEVLEDLDEAIEKDPNLAEAYLERILYVLRTQAGEDGIEAIQEDLQKYEELAPDSPSLYLYRAQINHHLGDSEAAFEDAKKANELDITLLPAYLVLGQTAVENGEYKIAIKALDTYMEYVEADVDALLAYGQALYAMEQYSETLSILGEALNQDSNHPQVLYYRGLTYIELDQGQKAVNDLFLARRLEPQSFIVSLDFGRALLSANRLAEARDQFAASKRYAETDEELAQVYYWRAITVESIGNQPTANLDWKALLELPEEAVPEEWIEAANERLFPTPTPSKTPTPTKTKTPRPTRTPTPTKTASATPKATATK